MSHPASASTTAPQETPVSPLPLSVDRQIEYLQLQADVDLLLEELETRCRQSRSAISIAS